MTISVIFEHHKWLEDANSTVFCKGGFGSEFVLGKLCYNNNRERKKGGKRGVCLRIFLFKIATWIKTHLKLWMKLRITPLVCGYEYTTTNFGTCRREVWAVPVSMVSKRHAAMHRWRTRPHMVAGRQLGLFAVFAREVDGDCSDKPLILMSAFHHDFFFLNWRAWGPLIYYLPSEAIILL